MWKQQTYDRLEASPAVVNGVVYIGSEYGYMFAFNANTERLCGGTRSATPIPSILPRRWLTELWGIGAYDQNVYALDAGTGAKLWKRPTTAALLSSLRWWCNGLVYIGAQDGSFYALNAEPQKHCGSEVPDRISPSPYGSPSLANGLVYIGSERQ